MQENANKEILSEREVSQWIGLSEPTLCRHRRNGTGPTFIRLSERRFAYRKADVEAWLVRRTTDCIGETSDGETV